MKLITSPKSVYLLNAGIEVLHSQSNEWLSEIAFWRDETAFFYALVVNKTLTSVPIAAKEILQDIEKELVSINSGELVDLQKEVMKHEMNLSHLLKHQNDEEEEDYRREHRLMEIKFYEMERRFKTLKKVIFGLVKLTNKK
jgi:hypothetical protein